MSTPDVTVVVAVYNTMPYLTECLESLAGQTIGHDRMEIVAVDDGSTDGSAAELDRWAARLPGVVTVVHQPNSGGPAQPSNRALDLARGRYVFFIGADDHLGPEALDRLVRAADELSADVVLGRMIGAGGRVVNQQVYADGNRDDISLTDSALPWALSNTKLFRRSLLEEHGIRYPENMRTCSDQPFTIRAVVAARRISVRADYDYYYAVRRTDSSNITYRTSIEGFVHDAAVLMDTAADVITDPVARDLVLRRHFTWELGKLLAARFLAAGRDEQVRVQEIIRKLAETYLSEDLRASLDVQRRVPLSIAQFGTVDDLVEVARYQQRLGATPVIDEGERCYVGYPGFRDPARGFPDAWFDGTAQSSTLPRRTEPADARWVQGPALRVTWPHAGPGTVAIGAGQEVPVGDIGRVEFPVAGLIDGVLSPERRRIRYTREGPLGTLPYDVTATGTGLPRRLVYRAGRRLFLLTLARDAAGRLVVAIKPVTPRRIAGRIVRKLRSRQRPA